ncbi:MAG: hypothetical protein JKX81_12720 [Arenicella sp.]|nr:hypothetical protein [Arenicella sp.]
MTNADFIQAKTPIQDVNYGGDIKPPRTSLDFVIRQDGSDLDDSLIRIESFSGQDSVAQLFEYQISFRANDLLNSESGSADLDFNKIVGSPATVRLGLPEGRFVGSYPDPAYVSFFNGIIADISLQQSGSYSCTLRPALWRLTLVNDYRQFSQMTIKEVIEDIVKTKWGLACDLEGLGSLATYRVQDWMQMGETDWGFVQSLLHKVGGYFYFIHDDVSHTVVFANNPATNPYYINLPPAGSTDTNDILPIYYTFSKLQSFDEDDYLISFSYQQKLVAPGTRNVLGEPQSAWEDNAPAALHSYVDGGDDSKLFQRYRIFQYGSSQKLVSSLNSEDSWSVESQGYRLTGQCSSAKFKAGHVFETRLAKDDCDRTDVCLMRPELNGQKFVILNVTHQANVDGSYSNNFTAAPANGNAHELDPSSTHVGSMLGRVVDKNSQRSDYRNHWMLNKGKPNFDPEVKTFYYDDGTPFTALGVYVDFPGLNVSDGPIWIKLSETMTTIPEAGVTVMVDRSRDDTDVPQISFIVEAKGSKTIMPNGAMENTRVGDDYSTSYGDSRNISYGADSIPNLDAAISKIDGEYASGAFKSASYSIGGGYSYSASNNGKAGTLSKSYSEGNTYNQSYANETTNHSEVGSSKSYSKVGVNDDESHVGTTKSKSYVDSADSHSEVGSNKSYSKVDSTNDESHTGTTTSKSYVESSDSHSEVSTSKSYSKVGSTNDESHVATSVRTSTMGASTDSSAIGVSNSNSVIGASNSNSVVGANVSLSAVGLSVDVSASGGTIRTTNSLGLLSVAYEDGVDVNSAPAKAKAWVNGLEAYIITMEAKI